MGRGEPLSALHGGIKLWAVLALAVSLGGCDKSVPKIGKSGSSADGELVAANLAAHESRNQVGLWLLNYMNIPTEGNLAGIRLASGRLLSSSDGRFKFEQTSSDKNKTFVIHFDPGGELTILFPKLEQALAGPATLLSGPEPTPLRASYEGVRFLLGQANVWSDPTRSKFVLTRSGATVESPDSPIEWNIRFQPAEYLFPIEDFTARSGSRTLLTIDREAFSYESLDMSGGGGIPPLSGRSGKGSEVQLKSWRFMTPKAAATTEIQLSPLGEEEAKNLVAAGALDAPGIPGTFKKSSLTPEMLANWLNLR